MNPESYFHKWKIMNTIVDIKDTITSFLDIKALASFIITNATFHDEIRY